MKKNIKKHVENVIKYKGSYYFDRNFANISIKFDEESNKVNISVVSYEDGSQQREQISSEEKVSDIVANIEKVKTRVKKRNSELKSDYLQLVDLVKETSDSNIVFDDKNVKVLISGDEDEITISLNINKDGWDHPLCLYSGDLSAQAVKAIKKAIHTGLCIQKGNVEVVSNAFKSIQKISV